MYGKKNCIYLQREHLFFSIFSENKAYNKPALQSSTDRRRGHKYIAEYAVDGKLGNFEDFTCTLTSKEADPWWRVDLGNYYYIQKIDVHNIANDGEFLVTGNGITG